jgi:outer membrane protein TolC
LNIRQIYRNLQNLVSQIEIARKSVENARLTYELNLEKYENGDLTSMDLSLYQNQLSGQKNELTRALINYKLELLNLKIQTLWDFESGKSIVPNEYSPEFENY